MATTVIAAAAARAERDIVDHLRRSGATTPEQATELPPLSPLARRRLDRLVHARVVRETGGRYWLDEAMYASSRSDRRAALVAALVAVLAVLVAVVLALRAQGG